MVLFLFVIWAVFSFAGCAGTSPDMGMAVVVQTSARVAVQDLAQDKSGSFFLRRSLLCRRAFAEAMADISSLTGRSEDYLLGATICDVSERFTNGVYSLTLDVFWSPDTEEAAANLLAVTNQAEVVNLVSRAEAKEELSTWIGPKQITDENGTVHFLGFSAMAIGCNTVMSGANMRRAELDAQAMAVRAFMGKDLKMTDVKATFRPVFKSKSHHPLCLALEMYTCGYEVVSLDFPVK